MTVESEKQELAEKQKALSHWISRGKIEMTQTGLTITDPDFSYDDYEDLGMLLAGFHRSSCWWIGDWILFGEKGTYGEKYAQAMEVTKLAEGTLMNYVSVCRRIPRSRRRIELPFSVHVEVAPLPPAEQKHWLAVASREGMRQRDLRYALKPVKDDEEPPPRTTRQKAVVDDIHSLARSICRQARGNGRGGYVIPGELLIRLAALIGEGGYE